MDEHTYDRLWDFVQEHRKEILSRSELPPVAVAKQLYEQAGGPRIPYRAGAEMRIVDQCIHDALNFDPAIPQS